MLFRSEEAHGDAQKARDIYVDMVGKLSVSPDVVVRYANFERSQNPTSPEIADGIYQALLGRDEWGELIWRFDSRIDRVYTEEELETFPEHMRRFLRIYSTWHEPTRLWVLCGWRTVVLAIV